MMGAIEQIINISEKSFFSRIFLNPTTSIMIIIEWDQLRWASSLQGSHSSVWVTVYGTISLEISIKFLPCSSQKRRQFKQIIFI